MTSLDGVALDWFEQVRGGTEFITLIDPLDRVLYVNHAPAGWIGNDESVYRFVDPQYHEVLRTAVAEARRTGLPQHYFSRALGLSGEPAEYSNWVVLLSGPGVDGFVAVIASDVTEQGRIEAKLELSELTLRSLIENSPDAIVIVDPDRRIEFVNRLDFGHGPDEVIGELAESFVPDSDRPIVVHAIEQALDTGEPQTYITGFDSVIDRHQFSTRVVPIRSEDGIDRLMLVATDVTKQVRADKERELLEAALHQAQKMESFGQLTGGVAHDFNNILVAISGNLELAELYDADPVERGIRIAAALEAVRHAKVLTERLLAFSRKQTLRPRPIDVGALARDIRDLLARTLGEPFRVVVDATVGDCSSLIDPPQLESAILNLAVNAHDAMPGGGDIRIRTSIVTIFEDEDEDEGEGAGAGPGEPAPAGRHVLLEVEDDGTGMTPEVAAQAFEPFFTTKAVGVGTGLGLSMVYGFVLQSGGQVRLLTEPRSGTTVQLFLPATDARPEPPSQRASPDGTAHERAASGGRELILVVEDNEMVRSLTEELLHHLGYQTVAAEGAERALELLASVPDIELMVTDVVLAVGVDGITLAELAHGARPGLPVLFVSGYPHEVLAARGVNDLTEVLLMKPYTTAQLADAVKRELVGNTGGLVAH